MRKRHKSEHVSYLMVFSVQINIMGSVFNAKHVTYMPIKIVFLLYIHRFACLLFEKCFCSNSRPQAVNYEIVCPFSGQYKGKSHNEELLKVSL